VHGTDAMVEAGMDGARIDQGTQGQLFDAAESLKDIRVNQIQDDALGDLDEPMDGIVDDLVLIHAAKIGESEQWKVKSEKCPWWRMVFGEDMHGSQNVNYT
jgi:hypothetical protein